MCIALTDSITAIPSTGPIYVLTLHSGSSDGRYLELTSETDTISNSYIRQWSGEALLTHPVEFGTDPGHQHNAIWKHAVDFSEFPILVFLQNYTGIFLSEGGHIILALKTYRNGTVHPPQRKICSSSRVSRAYVSRTWFWVTMDRDAWT